MNKQMLLFFLLAFILSCKNEKRLDEINLEMPTTKVKESNSEIGSISEGFMAFTINDSLAKEVGLFLKNDFLKSDYDILLDDDKKFQLAEIDLNNDGNNEVFINFFSRYFCGTGGCTLLLLDSKLTLITKFTVTQTPLFIQKEVENGWNTILVRFQDKFVKLVYDGSSYPSNPSVVTPVDYAPSGHDLVLFDDNYSPSKIYSF